MYKQRISNLERLRAAVQKGIDDSDAGRFAEVVSSEALSAHLAELRAAEESDRLQVPLPAPRGEPLPNLTTGPERTPLRPWTQAQVDAYRKQRIREANDANSAK